MAVAPARKAMIARLVACAPPGPVAATTMPVGGVTTGSVVSTTVTVAVAAPKLPAASVTLKVTRVTPIGYVAGPSWPIELVRLPSTTSVAVAPARKATIARLVACAPPGPVASTTMSVGGVTTGSVVSTTVTVAVAAPKLPDRSRTLKVTVVVTPRG